MASSIFQPLKISLQMANRIGPRSGPRRQSSSRIVPAIRQPSLPASLGSKTLQEKDQLLVISGLHQIRIGAELFGLAQIGRELRSAQDDHEQAIQGGLFPDPIEH